MPSTPLSFTTKPMPVPATGKPPLRCVKLLSRRTRWAPVRAVAPSLSKLSERFRYSDTTLGSAANRSIWALVASTPAMGSCRSVRPAVMPTLLNA